MPDPFQELAARVESGALSRRRWRPLLFTALVGAAVSLGLFLVMRSIDHRRFRSELMHRADVPATALQRELADHLHLLQSIGAFRFRF